MSKPNANPFADADFTKMLDVSKLFGEFKVPNFNYEAFAAAQRKNIEVMTSVNQAAFESFQGVARRQADLFRQGLEETSQLFNAVLSSQTPEEKFIRQAEASKVAVEKSLANVREISETMIKSNSQAIETLTNRLNEGLEEFRDIVKSGRAA